MTKPIAVAGIALAAVAAAGVGSYLAVRHAVGPAPETTASAATEPAPVAADPALAVAEPPPAPEATEASTETAVDVEPAAANPPPAPRREPATPRPAAARPATAARPAPAPRPVAPEPSPRPQPAAAPVTTLPQPAPAAAPAPRRPPADVARAAGSDPPLPAADLPVVEGWARAGGPARAPLPPPRTEPQPPPLAGTNLLDARAANPGIAPSRWPAFNELEIAADSVIGIQIETAVSTRTARLEDTVEARVIRDVQAGAQMAIPSGTRMRGSVVLVETGGRIRSASRLGVRFHTLLMDDGAEVALSTETIYREGKARGGDSVAKIGGAAVAGSILGAIFGGERGAAIGGSIGAAGGTAAALNGEAEPASLLPGSRLTVRLSRPALVTVPR